MQVFTVLLSCLMFWWVVVYNLPSLCEINIEDGVGFWDIACHL